MIFSFQTVFEDLRAHGSLEWLDPKTRRRCYIYWRSPEEWGNLIYNWAASAGQTNNTVCTFTELTEADETASQPFHGLERDLLIKALRTLEKRNKAEVFESEDGVKFFSS